MRPAHAHSPAVYPGAGACWGAVAGSVLVHRGSQHRDRVAPLLRQSEHEPLVLRRGDKHVAVRTRWWVSRELRCGYAPCLSASSAETAAQAAAAVFAPCYAGSNKCSSRYAGRQVDIHGRVEPQLLVHPSSSSGSSSPSPTTDFLHSAHMSVVSPVRHCIGC
jgi:hypothetical protein